MTNELHDALNRLGKWRSVLAGWMLGTRSRDEPGVRAVRDLQEGRLFLRVEMNALTNLLLNKGLITAGEFSETLVREIGLMEKGLERQFPGYSASDAGIVIDPAVASKTNRDLGFPP